MTFVLLMLLLLGAMFGISIQARNYEAPRLPEYIREMDAIRQWGISKATFIRARKKGLPFVRLGAFVCYKPEDLETYFCKPRSWEASPPKDNGGGESND